MKKEQPHIGRWLSILHRSAMSYYGKELASFNVGKGQVIFLRKLFHEDGIRQEDLAKGLFIDKGTTTRALLRLEKEGYIERREDEGDHRVKRVFLTPKAGKFKNVLRKKSSKLTTLLFEGFTDEEKIEVYRLTKKMAENAVRVVENEKAIEDGEQD